MTIRSAVPATLLLAGWAFAETWNLEDCRRQARANHPLRRQMELVDRTRDYDLSNAAKGWFPQPTVSVKYTDQSEAPMPRALKEQWLLAADLSQTIWDGGAISSRRRSLAASAKLEKDRLEVDLYALGSRVDKVFLGILLLERQIAQTGIQSGDLAANLRRVEAYLANGVANRSDVDALEVEILRLEQRKIELGATLAAYRDMLGLLVGRKMTDSVHLESPSPRPPPTRGFEARPEMAVFEAQSGLLEAQKDGVKASNRPRLGVFGQIGYGKPGLALAEQDWNSYWTGGAKLTWELGGFWRQRGELSRIEAQKRSVDAQREAFALNVSLELARLDGDVERLRGLLERDDRIVALRERLRKAAESRLDNGVISVSDLVREVDAEALARQEKALHEMQLLSTIAELNSITNDQGSAP